MSSVKDLTGQRFGRLLVLHRSGSDTDRIDVDGNYEPNNCRWATALEQRLNQRPRKRVV